MGDVLYSVVYSSNKNIVIIHERLIKQSRRTSNVTDPIHLVTLFVTPRVASSGTWRGHPIISVLLFIFFFCSHNCNTPSVLGGSSAIEPSFGVYKNNNSSSIGAECKCKRRASGKKINKKKKNDRFRLRFIQIPPSPRLSRYIYLFPKWCCIWVTRTHTHTHTRVRGGLPYRQRGVRVCVGSKT